MRLSLPRFVALLVALFAISYSTAFYLKRAAVARQASLDVPPVATSEPPAEPPPPPFEQTADRKTLGSGIEPDPQIGALATFDAMLRRMADLPDGAEKLQLAHDIGAIRDPAATPVLLDWATVTNDRALLRSALDALGPLGDAELVAEIIRRFTAAYREDDRYRLAKILRNITNTDAEPALIALAEDAAAPPQLVTAATESLATLATPTALSLLLGKLETAPPDDTARLSTAIARIDRPEALSSLQYAAQGNKDAASDRTRIAAIHALGNFTDDETHGVLARLSSDPVPDIRDAARDTLARIRKQAAF